MFIGPDVGTSDHHAVAVTAAGRTVRDKALPNDEARLRASPTGLGEAHGPVLMVADQPATIGALPVAVAQATAGMEVAHLSGLAMRRVADLHPGTAKAGARDVAIIAEAARSMPYTLRNIRVGEAPIAEPAVLAGTEAAATVVPILAGRLASYAGITPVTRRSGTSTRGEHAPRGGERAPEKSAVPLGLRLVAPRPVTGLLQPEASPGQVPQPGHHRPGPPTDRCAVRDAGRRYPLPRLHRASAPVTGDPGRLTKTMEAPRHPRGAQPQALASAGAGHREAVRTHVPQEDP